MSSASQSKHQSLGKHRESLPAEVRVRPDAGSPDSTGVSRRIRRASELLPRLASAAVPEAEAPLLPDPHNGAGLCLSFFCASLASTLGDGSVGFSTRRDD